MIKIEKIPAGRSSIQGVIPQLRPMSYLPEDFSVVPHALPVPQPGHMRLLKNVTKTIGFMGKVLKKRLKQLTQISEEPFWGWTGLTRQGLTEY